MNYFKKIGFGVLYFLEFIVAFLSLYFTIVIIGLLIPINTDYKYSEREIQFYVISNGVHTDICLPVSTAMHNWMQFIPIETYQGIADAPKYISIGWGDKGFYLDTPKWSDLKFTTAFEAMFLPSATAMHVSYLVKTPREGDYVKLCSMDEDEYMELILFITSCFYTQNGFNPELIKGKGYTSIDNFYEANYSYHLLRTCNTWTNEALTIAGVKTSVLALFEQGILRWI